MTGGIYMKKNLKFLLTAIISIISLSAVTTSAMQNNPNDDEGLQLIKVYGRWAKDT